MDLLAFERKLDQTIMRKRLDIQEALKRPIKVMQENTKQQAKGDNSGTFFRFRLRNQIHSNSFFWHLNYSSSCRLQMEYYIRSIRSEQQRRGGVDCS